MGVVGSNPIPSTKPFLSVLLSLALTTYLQLTASFFAPGDPAVPAALLTTASTPLPAGQVATHATATDGAIWLGTPTGLIRLKAAGATRPDYRFFAGRRYLPDNHILALLPDSSAGMWVKTTSGVSHIQFKRMAPRKQLPLKNE